MSGFVEFLLIREVMSPKKASIEEKSALSPLNTKLNSKCPASISVKAGEIVKKEKPEADVAFVSSSENVDNDDKRILQLSSGYYACAPCGVVFKTELRLNAHIRSHKARRYACFICNRYFSCVKNLKIHLSSKLHSSGSRKSYHCGHCQKRFITKRSYLRHRLTHLMSGTVIKCDRPKCFKRFARLSDLLTHLKTHKQIVTHQCNQCHRTFPTCYYMDKHRCVVPFVCKCGQKFATRLNMNLHAISHRKEKPAASKRVLMPSVPGRAIVCDVCFRRFRKISHLRSHKASIHAASAYECDQCTLKFDRKIELLCHRKIHKKTYHTCKECGKITHSSYIKRHMALHEDKVYKCDVCSSQFRDQSNLDRHRANAHRVHKCPDCFKTFEKVTDLHLHSKSHLLSNPAADDSPGLLGYLF